MSLRVVPISLHEANAFVARHHRHHQPARGCKFTLAVANGVLVGVAVVGRPNAQGLQDGETLEVTRTCTDGTRNANSMLYGRARRVAQQLGYDRVVTYNQEGESGASLLAAGYCLVASRPPRSWAKDNKKRTRTDKSIPAARGFWVADHLKEG